MSLATGQQDTVPEVVVAPLGIVRVVRLVLLETAAS
jgi:hypothetical protein